MTEINPRKRVAFQAEAAKSKGEKPEKGDKAEVLATVSEAVQLVNSQPVEG